MTKAFLTTTNARRALKRTILATSSVTAMLVATALTASAAEQTAQTPVEEIVVTGTRVVRDGFEAPTPLTVMNEEDIYRDAPTNIADFVNKMPMFANSPTGRNSTTSDATQGVSSLNLRSLGANRTLTLLDGVRVVGSTTGGFYNQAGAVDISSFPDSLISRVDVVTGGASAAYGSDAMAGVVNFILDKEFTGVKGSITGGVTTYGDDRQYLITLTAGTPFAGGRGHFLISGSTNYNQGIMHAGSAREWVRENRIMMSNPNYTDTNGQPFYLIRGQGGSSVYTSGGLINSGPLRGIDFGPGGVPRQFNYGSLDDGYYMSGGDWMTNAGATQGALGVDTSLDNKLTRHNLFARASFDVTDNFSVYAQFNYSITNTFGYCCVTSASTTITNDNPFIPGSVLAQMTAQGITSFDMSNYNTTLGAYGQDNTRQFNQYVIGANGKFDAFDSNWSWDIYATRSISRASTPTVNNLNVVAYGMAVDVVRHPTTGLPVCRSTLSSPGNGCIPYNPMGIGVNSRAAIDYVQDDGQLNENLEQDVIAATVRGEPFSTWAGPVSLALGVEHRKEEVSGRVTALDAATSFWVGNFKATNGKYTVNEGFFETVVPLAKDAAWAKSLDLNAGLRVTDYSTSGKVITWKVGATYAPIDGVRFRATRSRDIRSPNLGELFSAGQAGTGSTRDPFQGNLNVPTIQFVVGNPVAEPEEADTTGVGVVLQPTFLPGFSASFDYYKIDISKAISVLSSQATMDRCFAGIQVFCDNIDRSSSPILIYIRPTNTAFAKTDGFDMEASYTQPLADLVDTWSGSLSARVLATHVMDLTTVQPDGAVLQGLGVHGGAMYPIVTAPKWRYTLMVGYDAEAFSAAWTGRGISSGVQSTEFIECTSGCPAINPPIFTIDNNRMPAQFYMDLSLTYHLKSEGTFSSDLYFTVENMANVEPDYAIVSFTPGMYDQLGRIFRAGVRFKM